MTKEEGEALKTELGCAAFYEVSAKTRENLEEVFMAAVKIVAENHEDKSGGGKGDKKDKKNKKNKKCLVM